MKPRPFIVAGIMSGTSGDGIDVALTRIEPRATKHGNTLRLRLLAHEAFPFPKALRAAVLAAQDAQTITTAELARLNWRLGVAYADAVEATREKHSVGIDLIGCHGQTIYHQAKPESYCGKRFACTWQIGEPAVIATRMQIPVASNFRPADMVAGGQGAPLVPLLDYVVFADPRVGRVLQNIGGIGNLTAIPAGAGANAVIAFDTGPGNMVIDALMQDLFHKPYDRDGRTAARGRVLANVVEFVLKHPFFRKPPPPGPLDVSNLDPPSSRIFFRIVERQAVRTRMPLPRQLRSPRNRLPEVTRGLCSLPWERRRSNTFSPAEGP